MKPAAFIFALLLFASCGLAKESAPAETSLPARTLDDPAMLDFWLGEWDLTWQTPEGETAHGKNVIDKILGGAVIHESFSGSPGMDFDGESFSVLERRSNSWKQTWVSSSL